MPWSSQGWISCNHAIMQSCCKPQFASFSPSSSMIMLDCVVSQLVIIISILTEKKCIQGQHTDLSSYWWFDLCLQPKNNNWCISFLQWRRQNTGGAMQGGFKKIAVKVCIHSLIHLAASNKKMRQKIAAPNRRLVTKCERCSISIIRTARRLWS